MKERLFVLFYLLFLFIGLVVGVGSENEVQISINGCSDGVNFALVGDCLGSTGYCAGQNLVQDVFTVPNACARGHTPPSGFKPYNACCPANTHECSEIDEAGEKYFLCVPALNDCSFYTTFGEDKCLSHYGQCSWNGTDCVPRRNTCYDYTTSGECNSDPFNVSKVDPNCRYGEIESNGIPYIIPADSCECVWDDTEGCKLRYNITPSFGDGTDYAVCEYRFEITQPCTEGFETYTYIADYSSGTYGADNPILQHDARCTDRTGRRRCGEAIVKVPFFSYFNFILVFSFLAIFYIIKIKFFGEKE